MDSQWIVCAQCDTEFEYNTEEQAWHARKGFDAPRRCPECRKHKNKYMSDWESKEIKERKKHYRRTKERQ
jgi:hypothetical protein